MTKNHLVKSWPEFFEPICQGIRTHDLRRNDREYNIGDILILREFESTSERYTGRECEVEITSMTSFAQPCAVSGEALNADFCILSIRLQRAKDAKPNTSKASSLAG
jgi:hypothetical protein